MLAVQHDARAMSTTLAQAASTVAAAVAASSSAANRAPPQGGVLDGQNPTVYDPKNPIIVFIIQVSGLCLVCWFPSVVRGGGREWFMLRHEGGYTGVLVPVSGAWRGSGKGVIQHDGGTLVSLYG